MNSDVESNKDGAAAQTLTIGPRGGSDANMMNSASLSADLSAQSFNVGQGNRMKQAPPSQSDLDAISQSDIKAKTQSPFFSTGGHNVMATEDSNRDKTRNIRDAGGWNTQNPFSQTTGPDHDGNNNYEHFNENRQDVASEDPQTPTMQIAHFGGVAKQTLCSSEPRSPVAAVTVVVGPEATKSSPSEFLGSEKDPTTPARFKSHPASPTSNNNDNILSNVNLVQNIQKGEFSVGDQSPNKRNTHDMSPVSSSMTQDFFRSNIKNPNVQSTPNVPVPPPLKVKVRSSLKNSGDQKKMNLINSSPEKDFQNSIEMKSPKSRVSFNYQIDPQSMINRRPQESNDGRSMNSQRRSERSVNVARSQNSHRRSIRSARSNNSDKMSEQLATAGFLKAIMNHRDQSITQEISEQLSIVDPHPDLVEGIFYIDKTSFFGNCLQIQKCSNNKVKQKIVVFDRRSCYLFSHDTRFRQIVVAFTQSNFFETLIVLAIFFNSMILAITDYNDRDSETKYNIKLEQIGAIFSYIFIIELVLKVIAMGFIKHQKSYLRDAWNWLDFIVVLTSLAEIIAGDKGAESLRALRVLRVLRPLKSINAFPKMRRLIGALLSSLPNLGNAVLFMLFIFLLFGILGVQQFGGSMYQRCRFNDKPNLDGTWPIDESIPYLCSKDSMGNYQCPEDRYCHSPVDEGLSMDIDDLNNDDVIDYGITVFDNLGIGLITVFQMITLEGWAKIMYNLADSNISWMAILFSISLIMIGSFFLLNVILAVLAEALNQVDEVQQQAEAKVNRFIAASLERRKKQDIADGKIKPDAENENNEGENLNSDGPQELPQQVLSPITVTRLKSVPDDNSAMQNQHDGQQQIGVDAGAQPMLNSEINEDFQDAKEQEQSGTFMMDNTNNVSKQEEQNASFALRLSQTADVRLIQNFMQDENIDEIDQKQEQQPKIDKINNSQEDQQQRVDHQRIDTGGGTLTTPNGRITGIDTVSDQTPYGTVSPDVNNSSSKYNLGVIERQLSIAENSNLVVMQTIKESGEDGLDSLRESSQSQIGEGESPDTNRNLLRNIENEIIEQNYESPVKSENRGHNTSQATNISVATSGIKSGLFSIGGMRLPPRAQRNCLFKASFIICTHWVFTLAITVLIMLNTAALAMDSYPKNTEREEIANLMNEIFSWCFFAEMIIKLLGLGFKEYTRDSFNIFDAILVIVSLVDFAMLQMADDESGGSGGALSAFRGVRLLRVFKLARSWKSFRELLATILLTLKEITTFSILLIICMFIFILLGMEIFGHKIKFDQYENIINSSDTEAWEQGIAPRPNFDSLYMAFVSIFIVFIGEDWQAVMHSHYRVTGNISLMFFPILYIFLNLILLNLFLAVLLQSFEQAEDEHEKHQDAAEEKTMVRLTKKISNLVKRCKTRNRKINPQNSSGISGLELSNRLEPFNLSKLNSDKKENDDQASSSSLEESEISDNSEYMKIRSSLKQISNTPNESQPPFKSKNVDGNSDGDNVDGNKNNDGEEQSVSVVSVQSQELDELNSSNYNGGSIMVDQQNQNPKYTSLQMSLQMAGKIPRDDREVFNSQRENSRVQRDQLREPGRNYSSISVGAIKKFNNVTSMISNDKQSKEDDVDYYKRLHAQERLVQFHRQKTMVNPSYIRQQTVKSKQLMSTNLVNKMSKKISKIEIQNEVKVVEEKRALLHDTDNIEMSIAHLKKIELLEEKNKSKKVYFDLKGKSCGILGPKNPLRRCSKAIIDLKHFDNIVMFLILMSTILLTLDNPLNDPDGEFSSVLKKIDYFMTVAFAFECIINVMMRGFVFNGPDSYLKDSWNILDFLIVLFSLISLAAVNLNLEILKVFRMLRVLRPLRVLKRNFGLKIQVVSLLNSIPGIVNLLAITMLLLMLFGIQGVTFFAGKMYYCNMENMPESVRDIVKSEWDCYDYGGEWIQYESNFDNVGMAMLTMFTMMTTEGWNAVMFKAIDSTQIHQVPSRDNQPIYILFFIAFLIFGSLFILNLFVGVVLNTFSKEKDKLSHNNLLTKLQTEYLEVMKNCYETKPMRRYIKTGNRIRDLCRDISEAPSFNYFILICIILNSICLSVTWQGEPDALVVVMEWINIIFTFIYTIEMIIKLISMKSIYFEDGWNKFDALIVLFAWVGMFAEYVFQIEVGALSTVVRAFRILRVLKLIQKAKNLQKILNTFLLAIPELANVGALLFLFLFLFSVLGVFLFSGIKLQENLNRHSNFQHFGAAILTLFKVTTGEGWNEIMYDCARQRDILFQCENEQTYEEQQRDGINGCGTNIAYIYYVGFMLVVSLIFLNLFIAIILEGQLQATQQQDLRVAEEARNAFQSAWTKYDPDATGMIKQEDLQELIMDLVEQELTLRQDPSYAKQEFVLFNFARQFQIKVVTKITRGIDLDEKEEKIKENKRFYKKFKWNFSQFIGAMQLPIYHNLKHYQFHDCFTAFVKNVFAESHTKKYNDRIKRIEDAILAGNENELRLIDRIQNVEDQKYWDLDIMDQEDYLEADDGDFQKVLNRLENKGNDKVHILKLNEVRKLRIMKGLKLKDHLDMNVSKKFLYDSSHLMGAMRFEKFILQRRKRRIQINKNIATRMALEAKQQQEQLEGEKKENDILVEDQKLTKQQLLFQQPSTELLAQNDGETQTPLILEQDSQANMLASQPDAVSQTFIQEEPAFNGLYTSDDVGVPLDDIIDPIAIQKQQTSQPTELKFSNIRSPTPSDSRSNQTRSNNSGLQKNNFQKRSKPKDRLIKKARQNLKQQQQLQKDLQRPNSPDNISSPIDSKNARSSRKQQNRLGKNQGVEKINQSYDSDNRIQHVEPVSTSNENTQNHGYQLQLDAEFSEANLKNHQSPGEDYTDNKESLNMPETEFDELDILNMQKQNSSADNNVKTTPPQINSAGSSIVHKKMNQSRDGGSVVPQIQLTDQDGDMNGGMPAGPTDPSFAPISEIDDRFSMTQSQNLTNALDSVSIANLNQPNNTQQNYSFNINNQANKNHQHQSKMQLDSKGGDAASVSKTQSAEFLQLSQLGQNINSENKYILENKLPKNKTNQHYSPGIHLTHDNILKVGNNGEVQDQMRKAPSSRILLSHKQINHEQLHNVQQTSLLLHRSKTLASKKQKQSLNVGQNNSPEVKREGKILSTNFDITPVDVISSPQSLSKDSKKSNGQITNPNLINYRAGNFQQRSSERQKRMTDAYKPQAGKITSASKKRTTTASGQQYPQSPSANTQEQQ